MFRALKFRHLQLALPILIIILLALIPRMNAFQDSSEQMSLAILLDLLLTIPILLFLISRNTQLPKLIPIYAFLGGLLLAIFIIPEDHQQLLSKVKYISIPLIEIGLVSMLLYKMSLLNKSLKTTIGDDFLKVFNNTGTISLLKKLK